MQSSRGEEEDWLLGRRAIFKLKDVLLKSIVLTKGCFTLLGFFNLRLRAEKFKTF